MKARLKWVVVVAACLLPALPVWAAEGDENYQKLVKLQFGEGTAAVDAIEQQIRQAPPAEHAAIEGKLLAVLQSADATRDGRQFACKLLRMVMSSKSVPVLAKLLGDPELSHMARYALAVLKDPSAGQALQAALASAKGPQLIGVIGSLGDRREAAAVGDLAKLIDKDPALNQAVLRALGKIGTVQAADALDKAAVPDCCTAALADARVVCAQAIAASDPARAEKTLRSLMESGPGPVKAAAFVALVQLRKEQAADLILKAAASQDKHVRRSAGAVILTVSGSEASKSFAKALTALPTDQKIWLLSALAARGESEGLTPAVNALAADQDAALRQAAIEALTDLGDASSAAVLVKALAVKEAAPAASASLRQIQAKGFAEAVVAQMQTADPAVQVMLLDVLAARKDPAALPAVRKSVAASDAKLRQAAIKALGELGGQDDLGELVKLVVAARDNGERELLARSLAAVAARQTDRDKRVQPVIAALDQADEPAKVQLLTVLAQLGGPQALQTMRTYLAQQGELKKAAVRALAEWPTTEPLADLLKVAQTEQDAAMGILAFRGYVRLAEHNDVSTADKLKAYATAMDLAKRPEEKKLVLGAMAQIKDLKALQAVEPCLEQADIQKEAYAAYERIASSLARNKRKEAKAALLRVAEKAPDAGLRKRAQQAADKIK
ncbi:MAG TPA: HEAT repeat domain-containing protein [Phycisphaerae bacterium]|nr:HEAT repeat domain-containing protein [Phycisphaerae bacterium]HQL71815.1 HEAT repeat domain-containing protein [Phycisphaerae bacterium]